jgi:hypothetical protein
MPFLFSLLAFVLTGAQEWVKTLDADGYTVERRDVPGGKVIEVRASAHSPCPPKKIFDVIWKQEDYDQFIPYTKKNHILKDEGKQRVVYSQLALPVIQDRDFTVRIRSEHDEKTGLYLIYSDGADKEGPPENKDYARIRFSKTSWTLEPTPDGGTDATYVVASESGGIVPQWIQNIAQRDAARNFVAAMLGRNHCAPPKK